MTISTRAESAASEEARGLLGELYAAIYQKQQGWASPVNLDQFNARLDCEAYVDAAMMLVPEGCRLASMYEDPGCDDGKEWRATLVNRGGRFGDMGARCYGAATPALALIAAIARSIEP